MKKVLIITVIALLLMLTGFAMISGLKIGGLSILGIKELNEKNSDLDFTLQDATKLASTDYQKKINELNEKIKELDSKKQEYQDKINVSTENQLSGLSLATQPYKIEYLWVIIGNHAKTEGVEIKMDVDRSSSGSVNYYNLKFTVTGLYVAISEFITDIEDDSSLGFKIEEFKMNSSSAENSNTLQATFVCKDIKIEGISSQIGTDTTINNSSNTTTENTMTENKANVNSTTNTVDNKNAANNAVGNTNKTE